MSTRPCRILIIGAGVAGASVARRVRRLFGDAAEIIVLEASHRIGGRACRIAFAGTTVEVGGTLLHSSNRVLNEACHALGFGAATPSEAALRGINPGMGVWTGQAFAVEAGSSAVGTMETLLARYGAESLTALTQLVQEVLAGVDAIYARLDNGERFTSPAALISAVGLDRFTGISLADAVLQAGASARIVEELCAGFVRNMYTQNAGMMALPGLVGLIGAGLAGGSLYGIDGGNDALVRAIFADAGAEVRLGSRAHAVGRDRVVHLENAETLAADAVVIAAPLTGSGIQVETALELPLTQYRRVYVTLAAAQPSPAYFARPSVPSAVFTSAACTDFNSLGVVGQSMDTAVLKFFSTSPLSDADLARLLVNVNHVERLVWDAYPVMHLAPVTAPFELGDGVYFANAFEPFVSTLETEAIAGRIVADLVYDRLAA